jgi:hypothetical protein
MREHHKDAFFEAAEAFTCWIGLREPNSLADDWIGRSGYIPKPVDCKAKTADQDGHRLGGLVVNPLLLPAAFQPTSRDEAVKTWKQKFLLAGLALPPGYTCVESGPDRGLVRRQGSAIYSDLDLMALLRSNARGEKLFTSEKEQEDLFTKVEMKIRFRLGVPLIQHGAEFMWKGGVGARESEWVLWFGPGHRFERGASSMPHGGH